MTTNTYIRTGIREIDDLLPLIGSFLKADVLEMTIDGQEVRGFRTPDAKSLWIRDHCDMLRVGRYFLSDVPSAVQPSLCDWFDPEGPAAWRAAEVAAAFTSPATGGWNGKEAEQPFTDPADEGWRRKKPCA